MYPLTFQPFVGKDYASGGIFHRRVMVLGDSHYGSVPEADITRRVLSWYLDPHVEREGWMSTFLKFERSLVGHETDAKERERIWQSVAFYNYLQVLLSGPREAGTAAQYAASSAAFFEVMARLHPSTLIVWGKRLWQCLPEQGWTDGTPRSVDGYPIDHGTYTLTDGHKMRCVCVYHPSAGYAWDWWHTVLQPFIQ